MTVFVSPLNIFMFFNGRRTRIRGSFWNLDKSRTVAGISIFPIYAVYTVYARSIYIYTYTPYSAGQKSLPQASFLSLVTNQLPTVNCTVMRTCETLLRLWLLLLFVESCFCRSCKENPSLKNNVHIFFFAKLCEKPKNRKKSENE